MNTGKALFAQMMDFLPWTTFTRYVERYAGDHGVRRLPCAGQYRIMAFAQLAYRESLRDIEVCLGAQAGKFYHRSAQTGRSCHGRALPQGRGCGDERSHRPGGDGVRQCQGSLPGFPQGYIPAIHMPFHDPHGEELASFVRVRDEIRAKLVPEVKRRLGQS